MGDNSGRSGNAIKGSDGWTRCGRELIVPKETVYNGEIRTIEVIGSYSFRQCGCHESCGKKGETVAIKVSKEIKVIKKYGFSDEYDIISFEFEAGSNLQQIDSHGLHLIGTYSIHNNQSLRSTLVLPPSLSTTTSNSIFKCNLFHTIIYCGLYILDSYCTLSEGQEETKVKVSKYYPKNALIFGKPLKDPVSTGNILYECQGYITLFNLECSPQKIASNGPMFMLVSAFFINNLSLYGSL